MTCIIVDDEPLAREAIEILLKENKELKLLGSYNSADSAAVFMEENDVDLIFLDIQMPGTNGVDFAKIIPKKTMIIFTTAFSEFASESYEVDAIDYLIKPIRPERFKRSIDKAQAYLGLFETNSSVNSIEGIGDDYFFVKAERKIIKILFRHILFIEGLKDYVVLQTEDQKILTAMNIKTIHDQLPKQIFVRISKSYVININHIDSIDNNTVYIGKNEIPIGNIYREFFFDEFVTKKLFKRS
jgi:DNA-binding LytR/AlgR family response regulator